MRTIKFRGYNNETKRWYYGDLVQLSWSHFVIQNEQFENRTQVLTDSVGQFSGLTDKNGNGIYEGDILVYSDGRKFIVEWNNKMAGLWARELKYYSNEPHGYGFEETEKKEWQVIANDYENPELLKI